LSRIDIAYLYINLGGTNISRSRNIIGADQNLNGLRDLTTTLSGMICHSLATICHV